jgi:hypothetical protein
MLLNNRVVLKDNLTLRDLSPSLNDLTADSEVLSLVAAEDKIYLGSDLPFNHRYFYLSAMNAVAGSVTVDIWDGSEWQPAVDVLDMTKVSGAPFARSGIIQWTTDRNRSWMRMATTEDMSGSGLETQKIYNMYWVRLTFSANFAFTAKYVGHRFSTDADLAGYYPDLNRSTVMSAHTTGKTSWEEQHILAAEEIIQRLRNEQTISSPAQIFNWGMFCIPSVHKVAWIIMNAFGKKYEEAKSDAAEAFSDAMDGLTFGVDRDADGHLDDDEGEPQAGLQRV